MNKHVMHLAALGLIAAFLGLAAESAAAQEAGSRQTREFVQSSASSDQYEILAAQTALAASRNPDVRAFATRMLQDHQQLRQALMDAATRSGLKPPEMAMSGDQADMLNALGSAGPQDFDALYLKQQMLAHRSALVVEQMYAKAGDDANVRQSAASAVPVISSHADMASQGAMKVGSQ
jgi:putative membrane protein